MIDRAALRALYDREMRADPPPTSGAEFDRSPSLVRERGLQDTILYAQFPSGMAPAVVKAEAERARRTGRIVEWKVYAHDLPPELPELLEREGFLPDEPETLVVLDLRTPWGMGEVSEAVTVREVNDSIRFADALSVSAAAFGPSGSETLLTFRDRLSDPTARLFVAYIGGRPVAAGRLELPPGRSFASLWGGGTVPDARHKGVYRSLVRARAEFALEHGYRYLTVDARETSRPILERLGFVALSGIRGWVLAGSASPPAVHP